jgi:predicted HTH transcriptional regulator
MVKQNILPPFEKRIWQHNYWEHIIRNENEYYRISRYINNNPNLWACDILNGGKGNIVIERTYNEFKFSNPGTLLLPIDQIINGGISECRNPIIQDMFRYIGLGERAGSGMNFIYDGWNSQNWRFPSINEDIENGRIIIKLSMEKLITEKNEEQINSIGKEINSIGKEINSIGKENNSIGKEINSIGKGITDKVWNELLELSKESREKKRMKSESLKKIIIKLCEIHPLTLSQLKDLLNRNKVFLRNNYISNMINEETLEYLYPSEINHPEQAYKASKHMRRKC